MPINLSLLKNGDRNVDSFNSPLIQLNQGKEDKIPLPMMSGMVLTSDITGKKSWIEPLKLGSVSNSAFRGDLGQIAYNHSQTSHDYLPKSGGKILGDIDVSDHKLILNTTNNIEGSSSDTIITSNGFLKVKGLGIKFDSNTSDFTIRSYSNNSSRGISLYVNNDYISLGKWRDDVNQPHDEMVLSSSTFKIYIADQLRSQKISADVVTAGSSQLDSTGLTIGGRKVIDNTGTISGANIDLVADYESPWIYVAGGGNLFSIPHGLGTTPRIYQIIFSLDNSNSPSKQVFTIPHVFTSANNYWWYWWYGWNGYGANCYTLVESFNNSNYWIRTGLGGVYTNSNTRYWSGYIKVMFWK